MFYSNVIDLIGNTPLFSFKDSTGYNIYAKAEFLNPGGSIKDRIARNMIEAAEKDGRLKPGMTIIEPTSGNTGIGLALCGVRKGYKVIIVMPENMSDERKKIIRALGAELVLTPAELSVDGAVVEAERIASGSDEYFVPQQFKNPSNPEIHYRTTAVELCEQLGQKIDIYVFERVCKFLSDWNTMGPGGSCPNPITISFNLSRYHLYNPDLISTLTTIFNKYDVSPSHVEVELTESIMFDNSKKLISVMNDIKKAGFSISVDDFGSGYSSLNLLKEIPADVLKLDKEFLSKADDDKRENIIITSVIEMAKKLKMTTVAEGIETKKQSDLLRDMGCDVAQGYYYAKPMPEREFLALLYKSFLPPNT